MNKHYPIIAISALVLLYIAALISFIIYHKHKNKIQLDQSVKSNNKLIFWSLLVSFAAISTVISVELLFLAIKLGKSKNVVKDIKIIGDEVTLISNWNYWFIATIASSLLFFAFKTILSLYQKKYLDKTCSSDACDKDEIKSNKIRNKKILGASFAGDLIKTLAWPIIISIVTTINFKKGSPLAIIASLLIIYVLVTLVHFHHNISTNAVFGDLFFKNQTAQDKKNDIDSRREIIAKFKYIGFILLSSAICAIPFTGARLLMPQIFKLLNIQYKMEIGFNLFNSEYLDVFTNTDAFLTVCIIDCLCLILGFILIDFIAKELIIFFNKNEEIKKNAIKEVQKQLDFRGIQARFKIIKDTVGNSLEKLDIKLLFRDEGTLRNTFIKSKQHKVLKQDIERLKIYVNELKKSTKDMIELQKFQTFDKAIKYLESQMRMTSPGKKAKSYAWKIGLSIASTVTYHAITQIQASVGKYGISDWRSISAICVLLIALFSVGFLLHMMSGKALVGGQSIFNSWKKKGNNSYEEIFKDKDMFNLVIRIAEKEKENTIKGCGNGGLCRDECGKGKGENGAKYGKNYQSFLNFVDTNNNINDESKTKIKETTICMCESCCMPNILKKILLSNDLEMTDQMKLKLFDLLEQLTESNKEKMMSGDKMKGGSCPCSNLAKGDKDVNDLIRDKNVELLLVSMSKKKKLGLNA